MWNTALKATGSTCKLEKVHSFYLLNITGKWWKICSVQYCLSQLYPVVRAVLTSVVVKDLRLKDKDKESSFKDKNKDLMSKDEDKGEDLKIGPRSSRTRTIHRVSNKHPGLLEIELSEYQPYTSYVMATPAQSADTDSLHSPRKFLRTWTSEDKDKDLSFKDEEYKDEDLKIGPRESSRTRTFLEDNNTGSYRCTGGGLFVC